jgi:DNA-directed RNA polymerase specialized sigma subunit
MTALAQPGNRGRHPSARTRARAERTFEAFALSAATDDEQERTRLLELVIEMHLDLAHAEAARYRSRGIPLDDLRQVAALALTKAAHGFDVDAGHDFLSYAVPTIRGELRKYFRDHGWMIRPPRRIQAGPDQRRRRRAVQEARPVPATRGDRRAPRREPGVGHRGVGQ